MDVETVHRHREGGGGEGVLATPAFPATAIEAVAGVEFDMVAGEVSVYVLSPLFGSSTVSQKDITKTFSRCTTGNI